MSEIQIIHPQVIVSSVNHFTNILYMSYMDIQFLYDNAFIFLHFVVGVAVFHAWYIWYIITWQDLTLNTNAHGIIKHGDKYYSTITRASTE